MALFLILFSSENGTTWYQNKTKDFILMGSLIVISALVNFIPTFYKRPLLLEVTHKNIVTKKDHTVYVRNESSNRQRTIELNIAVSRRIGWNWLLNLYLKKQEVYIKIECNPLGIYLQAIGEEYKPYEIKPFSDGSGFYVCLTDFLKKINEHRIPGDLVKKVPFFIKETKDVHNYYHNSDASFYINPVLVVKDGKKAPKLLNWALNWKPEQHKIEYFQNGGH